MIKQLLVIFKLVLLTQQLCNLSTQIPNLYTYSVTLLNTNLNATQTNYSLVDENGVGSYAIAINQMDIMSPLQWNLTVGVSGSAVVVTFKNKFVNWIKISCIIWSSKRQDLIIGSSVIQFKNSSFSLQQEIDINRTIKNYDSSIAIVYLNGFKIANNSVVIQISVTAFKVANSSFGIILANPNNINLSSISISYLIFSPYYSNFKFYGDMLKVKLQKISFYDVSQQIPETKYKFFGFSGIKAQKESIKYSSEISSNYVMKMESESQVELTIQYIYFVPSNLSCSLPCSFTIIQDKICVQKCPANMIVIKNQQGIIFCQACSRQIHQIPNINNSLCICEEGYQMDSKYGKCIKIITQNAILNDYRIIKSSINNQINPLPNKFPMQDTNAKFPSFPQVNPTNCSTVNNSELINDKCVCKRGYINLSNYCIAIVSLGAPFSNQKPVSAITTTVNAIKASSACSQNQQFSITLNKCVCSSGYKMNGTKCISICSNVQAYNLVTNSCICIVGFVRINSICTPCISRNQYSTGSQICYPLLSKKYCRNNYILNGGLCLSCSAINISQKGNINCSVCQDGFTYNGVSCICPYQTINGACVYSSCGNKRLDQNQSCDDGNTLNGDGCSSSCIIEQDYYCVDIPSICLKTVCGDGRITGGEQCDDNNTINGDGCSSLCLVEANYTCAGCLSSCFKIPVGNISILTVKTNSNNVYIVLEVSKNYTFANRIIGSTIIQPTILSKKVFVPNVYCIQDTYFQNRFGCLVIFSSGVPNSGFIMLFNYNYEDSKGAIIFDFKGSIRGSC